MVVLAVAPPIDLNPVPSMLALLAVATCAAPPGAGLPASCASSPPYAQQALTDELTGAANRRALYAALDRGLTRSGPRTAAPSAVTPFALALVDLDHFKEVNDSFGHAAGDELLQAVVDRFTAALDALQTPHLLARLGGDEFACPAAGDRHAERGDGLRQRAAGEPAPSRSSCDDVVLHVQASIGIATGPRRTRVNRGDMLFAADAAMYAAKTSGERGLLPLAGRRGRPPQAARRWPRTSTPRSSGTS